MTSGLDLSSATLRLRQQSFYEPSRNQSVSQVALVCDLHEEQWPSMDLVADMLFAELKCRHTNSLRVQQIRPAFQPRVPRVPGLSNLCRNADRLIHRSIEYPAWLRRNARGYDLHHVVDHSYAQLVHDLPPHRTVVTCHDLDAFRSLTNPDLEPRPRWFRAMMSRVLDGLQKAAHVICVTDAVRNDIVARGLLPRERVTVIHNGIPGSCRPDPNESADMRAADLVGCGADVPVLLHVGSTIARKRIDVLLKLFSLVGRRFPEAILVRVGGPLTESQSKLALELGVAPKIRSLPFLDREVLAAVYRKATLLLQTSDAEGFGLPIAEAMGCGCPVVASDIPVLREVGGAAAEYCPVGNVEEWAETIVSLLSEAETEAWQRRRAAAIQNASRFRWSTAADQVARVYLDVLKKV